MDLTNKTSLTLVKQAVENGTEYLLSQINNGRWRGFPTLAGESDIWVTGFIVSHIFKFCEQKNIINEAQNFLIKHRQQTKGWSYSAIVPSDADSTAWCIMALQLYSQVTALELDKAKSFLWSHFVDKGVSTYNVGSGIREFISAPNNESIQGWTAAHPDVSIAAALADITNEKVPEIITWLISLQTKEGFIYSYWWRSAYYTTTLLLRVLTLRQDSLPHEQAKNILKSLVNNQLPEGGFGLDNSTNLDPFTTALALETFIHLSSIGNNTEKHLCAKSLVQAQNKDGSWDGNCILRIPAPNVLDPNNVVIWNSEHGGGNSFVKDKKGLFATAMACYALDLYKQTEMTKTNSVSIINSEN